MKYLKELFKKINFSPYWHLECIIAVPVILFFMLMSVLNYLK